MGKPIIAITMGDPASVGPIISIKALNNKDIHEQCNPIIVGDYSVMNYYNEKLSELNMKINKINSVEEAEYSNDTINVLDMGLIDIEKLEFAKVSSLAGDAAFKYVTKAIELANKNVVDATVTNALNKEAMNQAGHHYSGHTEIYAEYTNTSKYTMMLAHESLRVVHVSTHVSLSEACQRVKKDRVLDVIRIANKACQDLGIKEPKVGVAGLNPHCGEGGLFGLEEIREISPAIEQAKQEGINAFGPIPPDTIFSKARGGWYDIVVAMYHDQGHIPLKVVGFVYNQEQQKWDAVAGVNITLGLPIIRTSVDHGTAFDQVEGCVANELSLVNAIDYAITLAKNSK